MANGTGKQVGRGGDPNDVGTEGQDEGSNFGGRHLPSMRKVVRSDVLLDVRQKMY